MIYLLIKGGWVMGLILICSICSLAIILERIYRFWVFRKEIREKKIREETLRELEKNIDLLGIIAHVAPLLGLLGTVVGMIRAFMRIEELSGRVNASVLAGGIWEALLTTAFGLLVAIPSFVMYHYFSRRVDECAVNLSQEREFEI